MNPQTVQIIADILTGIFSGASVIAAVKAGLEISEAIKANKAEQVSKLETEEEPQ